MAGDKSTCCVEITLLNIVFNMDSEKIVFDFSNIKTYEWDRSYYFDLEANVGLGAFKMILESQELTLKQAQRKFKEAIDSDPTAKDLDEEYRGSYIGQVYFHEERTIEELKRQQRYGLCVSLFAFYEGLLKNLCQSIEREFAFKIKLDDLNRSEDLLLYWNYLHKVFEIDGVKAEPFYTPIRNQKIVRNIIAHQAGRATEAQANRMTIVPGLRKTKYGDDHLLEVEPPYLDYLIDKMGKFFNGVSWIIDERYKQLKK
jgi:hypothetical protein